MKTYEAASIRNICLLGHVGVGKTSLAEAMCFNSKATQRLGRVENGTSVFDARHDEKERKMTISMALGSMEWDGVKINLLDAPGFPDFLNDARAALRVVESAVVVVDAVSGPQVGTELVGRLVEDAKLPKVFFVNGMDKENVDFEKTIAAIRDHFGTSAAPLQVPLMNGSRFTGVIDLISRNALEYAAGGDGRGKKVEIPSGLADTVETMRASLMESVAESDEELMNKYFEAGELSDDELQKGVRAGVAKGLFSPVFCGCAAQNMGVDSFLNAVSHIFPSAVRESLELKDGKEIKNVPCSDKGDAIGFIFKTISEEHVGDLNLMRVFSGSFHLGADVANATRNSSERLGNMFTVVGKDKTDTSLIPCGDICALLKLKDTHTNDTLASKNVSGVVPPVEFAEPLVKVAISAKNKGDEDKISVGFAKLHEEDPSFTYSYQTDIRQSILSAMGDMHVEVILHSLKSRFKVEVERKPPKISYRETITKSAKYVEYTHKKQTGGAGQYARVFIDLEPLPRGAGYEFHDKIVGGVIDQSFRPSVDKGVRAKIVDGIIAGFPIVDVSVSLVDGKTHPVDSKDIAFQVAGKRVFKKAFEMASPILLEPVVDLKVTVPEDHMGDVMGDLSSRRGKISGMESQGKYQIIRAKVPEAEVSNYFPSLKSITQGRAVYTKTFSHYDPVPFEQAQKIIEASKKDIVVEEE
jgi:elongation factor G